MKMKMNTKTAISATASLLLFTPAVFAADPKTAPDNTWVSVYGEVTSVTPDTFELKYDSGKITVEFDDWDNDADAYKLVTGDKVTVTGKIDDDLFETRKIEASSAYVHSINTYYYASAADEEDFTVYTSVVPPVDGMHTVIQGTVTSIPESDEFRIMAGTRIVNVEVDEMSYNPLDDEGYQKIEVGDRVSVAGKFDKDFLEGLELVASSIITLSDNS